MALKKRVALELGQGTSLRSGDYTRAAERAVKDALWHNSLNMAQAFGAPKEAMIVDVEIAVQQPDAVDCDAVAKIFPYGNVTVSARHGGLDVPKPDGSGSTLVALAAVVVSFMVEETPA
ncbi:MAG: Lin0512 family protein [Alphaproteobacteria bacterium]